MAVDAGVVRYTALANFSSIVTESRRAQSALRDADRQAGRTFGPEAQTRIGGFAQSLGRTQERLSRFGQNTRRVGQQMSLGITLPLTIMGGVAVRTFATFDTAIRRTGAITNATSSEFDALREMALQLGADTQFSATDAADAMRELGAAGMTVSDILGGATESVLLLAGATGTDLSQAAAVVAQSMNAFRIEAGDTAHVADVMTQAVNQSALNMDGLAEAMAHAGQLGASAGQTIESVTATIQVLADQGVPAAQAGTAVSQMFRFLAAPASQAARDLIAEIGVRLRDTNGEMLQAPQLIENLGTALSAENPAFVEWANSNADINRMIRDGTISEEARLRVARDMITTRLLGVEGQKAFNLALNSEVRLNSETAAGQADLIRLSDALAISMGEKQAEAWIEARMRGDEFVATGADAVLALERLNVASDGVAATFEEKMGRSLARRFEELKGSLETLTIRIIDAVLPALERIVPMLIDAANWLGEFAEKHPQLMLIGVGLLTILAVMGPILSIIGGMASGLSAVIGLVAKLGAALVVTAAKYGLLGAAAQAQAAQSAAAAAAAAPGGAGAVLGATGIGSVAAVAAGIVSLVALIGVLAWKWDQVWTWMKENKALAAIIGVITAWVIGPIMAAGWAIHELWTNWDQVMKWMSDAARWLGRQLAPVWQGMQSAWDAVTRVAVSAWHLLQRVWDGITDAAVSAWHLMQSVWQALQGAWDVVTDAAVGAWHLLQSVWDGIVGVIRWAWSVISGIFDAIGRVINATVIPYFRALGDFIGWQFDLLMAIFSDLWDIVESAFRGIQKSISLAWRLIRPVLQALGRFLSATLGPAFRVLLRVANLVWTGIKTAIRVAWNAIRPVVTTLWNWIKDKLPRAWNTFKDVARTVWSKVTGFVRTAWNTIRTPLSNLWDWLKEKLPRAWRAFSGAAGNAWDAVKRAFRRGLSAVGRIAGGFLGIVADIADAVGLDPVAEVLRRGEAAARSWGQAERGAEIGPGFVTKGASVVVGEGRRQHPEFVIPTDPRYRKRALGLFESLGGQLMAAGGVITGAPGWITNGSANLARILSGGLEELWPEMDVPNTLRGLPPSAVNTVRENVIDLIRQESEKMMATMGGANATGLAPFFVERWTKYNADRGFKFTITSGFRSYAQQAALYASWLAGTPGQAQAAPPGHSNHERGLAIDHTPHSTSADRAAAGRFQLYYPMSFEPWHIEPFETRKGGGITDRMTMALLHPNEMTLPSEIALPLRQAVMSGALAEPPPVEVTVFLGDEDLTSMLTERVIVKSGLADVRRRARSSTRVS